MRISNKEAACLTFVLFALMAAVIALFAQNMHLKQQKEGYVLYITEMRAYANILHQDLDSVCAVIHVLDPEDTLDTQQCSYSTAPGDGRTQRDTAGRGFAAPRRPGT